MIEQTRSRRAGLDDELRNMMPVEPSSSAVERVRRAIIDDIRAGLLLPGQRLTEAHFRDACGVARSTVREAFARLEASGVLAQSRNQGMTVRRLSRPELSDVYKVKAALEGLAASLAAPAVQADPSSVLIRLEALDRAADRRDVQQFSDANRAFHAAIIDAANNQVLRSLMHQLNDTTLALQFRLLVAQEHVFASNAEHHELGCALIAGDPLRSASIAQKHAETVLGLLLVLPDALFGPDA